MRLSPPLAVAVVMSKIVPWPCAYCVLNPAISGFYILAMILLCMHLYHGLWSMFQSLGFSHPSYTPKLKKGAAISAILIAIGNCSIPIAVLTGVLK